MVNFLLLYLDPLKRSFLLKFIEDAIKTTLLVSMLHKLLASITFKYKVYCVCNWWYDRGGYIDCIPYYMYFCILSMLHCLLPLLNPLTGSQLLKFTRTGTTSSCPCSVSKGTPACSSSLRSLFWTVDSPLLSGVCVTSSSASFVSIL